ncbi:MAG: ATPase, T2SS/T4P/T4SS family [Candidatus Micrarchaeia archaeon]|jgi:flagellar protein FlaI
MSLLSFMRRRKDDMQQKEIPLGFRIDCMAAGETREIIESPIQRSITRQNGLYNYNVGSNQKELSKQEMALVGRAKAEISALFLSEAGEMEISSIFGAGSFEKARSVALEYLRRFLPEERAFYLSYIAAEDTVGFGALGLLLKDSKNIEEIEINSPTAPINVYTVKYGRCRTNLSYTNEGEFRRSINKLLYLAENELSSSNPIVDAEVGNIRIHAQTKPYAHSGGFASIRIGGEKELNLGTLISNGTATAELLAYIWLAMDSKLNILISGAPASGKTTLLASLTSLIPKYNKIVMIEEEANELEPFAIGNAVEIYSSKKGVTPQQQVINALRMRPDRIIVGEIRGKEAREIFAGSNLGIPFMTTMHSNENGLAILHKLLVEPMGVEVGALAMLDLAIYMKQVGLNKRVVDTLYEYRWLSRGEVDGEEGVDLGGTERVVIEEVAKNGAICQEKLKSSKIIERFSSERGLSTKRALEELKKRANFLEKMREMGPEEARDKISLYGVGIG